MWNWVYTLNLPVGLEQAASRQPESMEERVQALSRQYQKEIALLSEQLYQHVARIAEAALYDRSATLEEVVSEEAFARSAKEITLYAFYEVMREQGGQTTQEQNELLELYTQRLQTSYHEIDLVLASRFNTPIRAHLESLFAFPGGVFWTALLGGLAGRGDAEPLLDTLVQRYGDIVMRFSVLGDPNSEAPMVIMKHWVDQLNAWLAEQGQASTEEEADYQKAYAHMRKVYEAAAEESRAEEDGLPVQDLFSLFILGLVQVLLQPSKLSLSDKEAVLDGVVRALALPVELTGAEILNSVLARDEIGGTMEMMTTFGEEHGNLWQIVQAMAVRCGKAELAAAFLEACSHFMLALEAALTQEYPGGMKEGRAAEFMWEVAAALES